MLPTEALFVNGYPTGILMGAERAAKSEEKFLSVAFNELFCEMRSMLKCRFLLDRHALREIPRFIHVAT
jgi:hypothetical protein